MGRSAPPLPPAVGAAAALVLVLLLWRSAGFGWAVLFAAFAAAVVPVAAGRGGRRVRRPVRAGLVLAAHAGLAAVLLAARAGPGAWVPGVVAARAIGALSPPVRPPAAAALERQAARDLAAHQAGLALAPLQQLVAVAPAAGAVARLARALVASGQWDDATLAALDETAYLGAGGPAVKAGLGQWYLQAAPGRPVFSLVAVGDLAAAAAAEPGNPAYRRLAVQAGRLAVDFYGPGPWWVRD
jgi:hypothetical protein